MNSSKINKEIKLLGQIGDPQTLERVYTIMSDMIDYYDDMWKFIIDFHAILKEQKNIARWKQNDFISEINKHENH